MTKNLDYIIVIPARYKSSRLPGKLYNFKRDTNDYMTCMQCARVVPNKILVATDDNRIAKICENMDLTMRLQNQIA